MDHWEALMAAISMEQLERGARKMDELVARDLPTYYKEPLYEGIFRRLLEACSDEEDSKKE
jgi:hypothetical protein